LARLQIAAIKSICSHLQKDARSLYLHTWSVASHLLGCKTDEMEAAPLRNGHGFLPSARIFLAACAFPKL
jgi:hypothetical protein